MQKLLLRAYTKILKIRNYLLTFLLQTPITYVTIPDEETPPVKQLRKAETDEKARAFVEKLKSRLGLAEPHSTLEQPPPEQQASPVGIASVVSSSESPAAAVIASNDVDANSIEEDVTTQVASIPPASPAAPASSIKKEDDAESKSPKAAQKDAASQVSTRFKQLTN